MSSAATTTPVVRPAEEADLPAADRVLCAAFERQASFLPHIRLHQRVAPGLFWVAQNQGQILGTVGAAVYEHVGYVGLMAVDPQHQRRGIARALVTHLLAQLAARDCTIALLDATDKGAPLYETFDFVDDGVAQVFELETIVPLPDPPRAISVTSEATLSELVPFDAAAFGTSREALLRQLLLSYSDRLLVARDSTGRLQGYLLARDPTLGPWVASDSQVAAALLAAGLRLPFTLAPHVPVLCSNEASTRLLAGSGFVRAAAGCATCAAVARQVPDVRPSCSASRALLTASALAAGYLSNHFVSSRFVAARPSAADRGGERNLLGADRHAVLGVAADLDSAGLHQRVDPLAGVELAGGIACCSTPPG